MDEVPQTQRDLVDATEDTAPNRNPQVELFEQLNETLTQNQFHLKATYTFGICFIVIATLIFIGNYKYLFLVHESSVVVIEELDFSVVVETPEGTWIMAYFFMLWEAAAIFVVGVTLLIIVRPFRKL